MNDFFVFNYRCLLSIDSGDLVVSVFEDGYHILKHFSWVINHLRYDPLPIHGAFLCKLKLLTTSKIDLETIFNSDQLINAKLYIKSKGKQYFAIKEVQLNTLKTYLPACQLIVHAILERQSITKTNWYVNLPIKNLNSLIGTDRKRITATHLLHELGIIDVNQQYNYAATLNHKKFSKSYCIADLYKGDTIEIDGYITLPLTSNKTRVHNIGTEFINKGKNINEGCITLPLSSLEGNTSMHPVVMHPSYLSYQIELIKDFKGKVSIGAKTNKIFTPVNQMKKEQRLQLKDKHGNRLIEVDLCTSHLQQLIKVIRDDIQSGSYTPLFNVEYMSKEMIEFKEAVLSCDFYNQLAMKYSTKYQKLMTREQAKLTVMFWLNSCYSTRNSVKLLKELYPQITHYIASVNGNTKNTLSIKLQKSEAYMVNELIIEEFATLYPESICYTIFDGFLVENRYLNELTRIIERKTKEYLKFDGKFKIKKHPAVEAIKVSEPEPTKTAMPVPIKIIKLSLEEQSLLGVDITTMPTTVDFDDYLATV